MTARKFGLSDATTMVVVGDDERGNAAVEAWSKMRVRYAQLDADVHASYFMRLIHLGIDPKYAADLTVAWIDAGCSAELLE